MNPTFSSNGDRRWMLVDDTPEFLTMLSSLIQNLTTATVECHDSPESALMAFAAQPARYDLVITDFEMPGTDGVELCRRLRAILPGQKVFLATGNGLFTETAARDHGFNALLNKPFPLAILREKLAAAGLHTEAACAASIFTPINNTNERQL